MPGKTKRTTARNGDPKSARRGAEVERAKAALGDAIDRRLNLDIEAMELAMLAEVIGVPTSAVRARLKTATLGELELWTRLITRRVKEVA